MDVLIAFVITVNVIALILSYVYREALRHFRGIYFLYVSLYLLFTLFYGISK